MSDPNKSPVDCGDNSCICKSVSGGMRTNGGCRCFENAPRDTRNRANRAVMYWKKRALDAEAELKGEK